jgi:putative endonuclease
MECWVYILKSLVVDRYYIGSTADLDARLAFHNSPRARWTKRYQPWELVHKEKHRTLGEALQRERELKSRKNVRGFLGIR